MFCIIKESNILVIAILLVTLGSVTLVYGEYIQEQAYLHNESIYPFNDIEWLVYLDYVYATEQLKSKILKSQYDIIFAHDVEPWGWNPDGSIPTIRDVNGRKITITSFEEAFPGWDFIDIMNSQNHKSYTENIEQIPINWNGNARPPFVNNAQTNGINIGPQFNSNIRTQVFYNNVTATFVSGPSQMPTVNIGFWDVTNNKPGPWRAGISPGQSAEISTSASNATYQVLVSTSERDNGLASFRVKSNFSNYLKYFSFINLLLQLFKTILKFSFIWFLILLPIYILYLNKK